MKSFRERLRRIFQRPTGTDYWEERAARHGARSVFNLAHTADELDAVTEKQIGILFPKLRSVLNGRERVALDFGCGTGRFSGPLSDTIGGRVVAVDPIQQLLDLAPPHPRVEYRRLARAVPLNDTSVDLVWICLVLGTLTDAAELTRTASEIDRVLAPDGLLFLVENTSEKPSLRHFRFRSEAEYVALFPRIDLHPVGSYVDAGERISILAGRKRAR